MPEVRLENVTRRHRDPRGEVTFALRDLSLGIHDGEMLALVGPSGSGKTTTLRLIAGLDAADDGVIRIDGRDMAGVPPHERGAAMVFQDHPLFPHLTVRENVGFGLTFIRLSKEERVRRITEVVDCLGLESLLDRSPAGLSGGERQRVALGAAVVCRPRLLLLDEPLAQVDAQHRALLRANLRQLQAGLRLTMVHVTHDQSEAMALADRVALLRAGQLEQVGGPLEVYRLPNTMFAAGFLGSPGMNLLQGVLRLGTADGDGVFTLHDGAEIRVPGPVAASAHDGERCVLGLRPEVLVPGRNPRSGFTGTVDLVEPSGAEALLGVRLGGTRLHAKMASGRLPRIGDSIGLGFAPGDVHWFSAATGRRLEP